MVQGEGLDIELTVEGFRLCDFHLTSRMIFISDLYLLQHFVKLYNEKRAALEEEQLHLNVGLNKIDETVEQVKRDVRIKKGLSSSTSTVYWDVRPPPCPHFTQPINTVCPQNLTIPPPPTVRTYLMKAS